MPQIPTYQPQVTARPIPYRPFSTEIPRVPDSGIGDTIRRASAAVDKVAERIQTEQDDARVTAALTALRRHAIETQNGENGYAKLLGENALTADNEGRGLIERVDTDMHDFGSGLASELTPRQQKLFNEKAQPIYMEVDGWMEDTTKARKWEELPKKAQDYILLIEKLLKTHITYVSVGPERDQLIVR